VVAVAENGRVALDLLESGLRPCAVLLDLMMPVMDGWAFRSEQIECPNLKDLAIVVITAAGFSLESIRLQFGDVPFIPKPADPEELLMMVKRACRDAIY
jgi:CheY-like chemotaxis protein